MRDDCAGVVSPPADVVAGAKWNQLLILLIFGGIAGLFPLIMYGAGDTYPDGRRRSPIPLYGALALWAGVVLGLVYNWIWHALRGRVPLVVGPAGRVLYRGREVVGANGAKGVVLTAERHDKVDMDDCEPTGETWVRYVVSVSLRSGGQAELPVVGGGDAWGGVSARRSARCLGHPKRGRLYRRRPERRTFRSTGPGRPLTGCGISKRRGPGVTPARSRSRGVYFPSCGRRLTATRR